MEANSNQNENVFNSEKVKHKRKRRHLSKCETVNPVELPNIPEATISNEGDAPKPNHRRGRQPIVMEYIQDSAKRTIMFSKRKNSMAEKMKQLNILTGAEVFLVIVSERKNVFVNYTRMFTHMGESINSSSNPIMMEITNTLGIGGDATSPTKVDDKNGCDSSHDKVKNEEKANSCESGVPRDNEEVHSNMGDALFQTHDEFIMKLSCMGAVEELSECL